jgi:penicillin-binding protein 2
MFSDRSERNDREARLSTIRLTAVQYGILAIMLLLVGGLWRLQVLGSDNYRILAEQNRIRKVPVLAPRGKLFDREGRILVDNYPSVSCFLIREQGHNIDADLSLIAHGLNIDVETIRASLRRYRTAPSYQPIPLKQDITPDEQAFIEAHRFELPELMTINEERRLYPRDGFASHLIGYVGEISEEDLNNPRYAAYEPGAVVGKAGIEQTYDELLRGEDGSRDVIVDSHGRELGYLRTQHAKPGKDLKLTLDIDLQKAAELALGDRNGAIVAMDPRNGEILALVSRPSFDPNAFSVRINRTDWNKLITDPDHPLMNKAIQAQLAPGSTFKILMSVAGLQEGVAQNLHVYCSGGADFYGHYYHCDEHHGSVDIHNAIPMSCDTFYYTLADKLGIGRISKYATAVGFGQKTGVDLAGEQPGMMPSEQWALKNYHRKWYAGETISVGIGQGAVEATPMQLARIIGGIASGGHFVRPHSVFPNQLTADELTKIKQDYPGIGDSTIPLDQENWMTITDGMAQVTQPGAFHTAGSAHLEGIDFAGKTGTAQVISHETMDKMKGAKTKSLQPNVWFVGVTPRRNPELVIAVLWQNGGFSYYPARIGAQIVEAYVEKKRRLAGNLPEAKETASAEVGAVWSMPAGKNQSARLESGHFFVRNGEIVADGQVAQNEKPASISAPTQAPAPRLPLPTPTVPTPSELGLVLPWKER